MRETVHPERAPRVVGPYSPAIVAAGLVWVSGQIALDPESGTLVGTSAKEQARQALLNLQAVIEAAGSRLERVVRTTVYLRDMADFDEVNAVYGEFFRKDPPARVCVEVSGLPKGARVEIDAVALS